ncbi:MAG: tyrosine-type recombinase/integrase, partial [Eubacteriales bacterium]|nr:tyrosine-type recombinase/integrase [Eubacteriales bacterium]
MICRYCKREVEDDSIFCRFCGEKLTREKKKKDEIKVPKPRQLKSGKWNIELKKENVSITEETEEECIIKAKAVRKGFMEAEKQPKKTTLGALIDRYIKNNEYILSPSTYGGYKSMRRCRFKAYMDKDVSSIDYQQMVNEESRVVGPKTVENAWRLVTAALRAEKYPIPIINTPQIPKTDLDFLDYEQIKIFLDAIKGDSAECAALLALHSLRSSELHALSRDSVKNNFIRVRGAEVRGENGYVKKETNKNDTSTRDVPIMIPRLLEVLPEEGKLVTVARNTINRHIQKICEENNLTVCTIHDLRRSFASLAYHLRWQEKTTQKVGGWADNKTVHEVYEKLSSLDENNDVRKMRVY